ncbi:glycosyltransferase family 4 protein [Bizionia sp. KMM 8389]
MSAVPGYSETFFRNKIAGLQAHGIEVVLFVTDASGPATRAFGCRVIPGRPFKGAVWYRVVLSIWVLFGVLLKHPRRSVRHVTLDRAAGLSVFSCVKRLVTNAFLFSTSVDWLHFGFGMLAVGREHVAASMGADMAVSFRGFDLYLSPLKHPGCYDLLFKKAVRYHVLSHDMQADLIALGISKACIHVIPPAIDVAFFNKELVACVVNASAPLRLVSVARLHWKKGLEYTLEALAILQQQGIAFEYTIIGSGSERERLVFAAHQLGISASVIFAGKMAPEAVKATLSQSDVYVQYSIQEGFCNAVLEAQAMGLLCVVSDAEGLAENVLDGKTGWVVSKRQPAVLARQLVDILNLSGPQQMAIRHRAQARVQATFYLEQQQAAFVTFYQAS